MYLYVYMCVARVCGVEEVLKVLETRGAMLHSFASLAQPLAALCQEHRAVELASWRL